MAKKKEDLSEKEMKARVRDLEKEVFMLRNELAIQRKINKPHLIREKRKQKARLLTLLTQKQKEVV